MVRAMTSYLTGIPQSDIRAIPAEIGGGFGGKTIIYLEPLATILAKKSGRPVKMVDDARGGDARDGPDLGLEEHSEDRRDQDGKMVAAQGTFYLQAGALPGLADPRCGRLRFHALRHRERATRRASTSCSNRSKVAAYRAPGAPIGAYAWNA
jgi:CO/xanthine dehydrogenase Mo-binding subunit